MCFLPSCVWGQILSIISEGSWAVLGTLDWLINSFIQKNGVNLQVYLECSCFNWVKLGWHTVIHHLFKSCLKMAWGLGYIVYLATRLISEHFWKKVYFFLWNAKKLVLDMHNVMHTAQNAMLQKMSAALRKMLAVFRKMLAVFRKM